MAVEASDLIGLDIVRLACEVYRQNTVHIRYRVTCEGCELRLELRPAMHFRPHEGTLATLLDEPYTVTVVGNQYEFSSANPLLPPLRMSMHGVDAAFTFDREYMKDLVYHTEQIRGYGAVRVIW